MQTAKILTGTNKGIVMHKVWRKWNELHHLFLVHCDTCGWEDESATSVGAGRLIDTHIQRNF